MVKKLTKEHFDTVLAFSRKISKGYKADDLSQHVIMQLLKKDMFYMSELISRNEITPYIWGVVNSTFHNAKSDFNREEYGTYDLTKRPNFIHVESAIKIRNDDTIIDEDLEIEVLKRVDGTSRVLDSLDCVFSDDISEPIDLHSIIEKAELTDKERMYLMAYKDANCNYTTCSNNLDICTSTISKYVKQAIKKCRKQL